MTAILRSVSALGAQPDWPNLILTKPSGVVSGDLLVAIQLVTGAGAGTPASVTAQAGFTQSGSTQQITDAGIGKVWTKTAGGAEPSTYTFGGDNRDGLAVVMLAVTAGTYSTGSPLAVAPTWGGSASVVFNHVAPTVSPAVADTLLLCAWAGRTFNNASSYTPPGGMTEVADVNPAWNYINASAATETRAASGATGTRTAAITRVSASVTVSLAIAPAVVSTGPEPGRFLLA